MSHYAWKINASIVGPGCLIWVRNPPESSGRRVTDNHWFLVVDAPQQSQLSTSSVFRIVGISTHPKEVANAVRMNRTGTPLKSDCFACLDWELSHQLLVVQSDEEDWDYEIRGAQLDRNDPSQQEPWYVDLEWFTTVLMPVRERYHQKLSRTSEGTRKKR